MEFELARVEALARQAEVIARNSDQQPGVRIAGLLLLWRRAAAMAELTRQRCETIISQI